LTDHQLSVRILIVVAGLVIAAVTIIAGSLIDGARRGQQAVLTDQRSD
jgi:hypothetical protein